MAVTDPSTVDTIAETPDGRVMMAMTEERCYAAGDLAPMVEDLRQKLNGYVYMIRSGQLRQSAGPAIDHGVEIRLFCPDEPPEPVQDLLRMAATGLAAEGVSVDWTVQQPTTEDALRVVAEALVELPTQSWTNLELTANIIGNGLTGACTINTPAGEVVPLQPDQRLIDALQRLKSAYWTPEQGTWTSFYARIEGEQIFPSFGLFEPSHGVEEFPPADWAEELRRYPRPDIPTWWKDQLDIATGGSQN